MESNNRYELFLPRYSYLFYLPSNLNIIQNKNSTIEAIRTYFDPSLKDYNYEEISYGTDCRIYASDKEDPYANIRFAFFDMFAFAHAAGWFIKTLVVRDVKLIIFESVAF